ncbi:MAG: electron transfer flavoprotein subunit alpha/FixB family protein [Vicingaceae bacterium]
MSILVYANTQNNKIHKSAHEAISYASRFADGEEVVALLAGEAEDIESLGQYGADKILQLKDAKLKDFQPTLIARALKAAAEAEGAKVVVFSHDLSGKSVAPLLAGITNGGLVSGAVELPNTDDGFVVKKAVFSGKAFANTKINAEMKIISVMPNSVEKIENQKSPAVEEFTADLGDSRLVVKGQQMESADLPLTEADKVVSAGRGLKGPENWGIIEELAKELGAATACSRPVSDMDWRPHHEHVGQTGVAIRPNLYIAVGISGAIQHLAGVNQSKVIVVINTDPEAPFFKSADYGIVGDAFEVVPKLIEKAKSMNLSAD